jgi:hypothetical protein
LNTEDIVPGIGIGIVGGAILLFVFVLALGILIGVNERSIAKSCAQTGAAMIDSKPFDCKPKAAN